LAVCPPVEAFAVAAFFDNTSAPDADKGFSGARRWPSLFDVIRNMLILIEKYRSHAVRPSSFVIIDHRIVSPCALLLSFFRSILFIQENPINAADGGGQCENENAQKLWLRDLTCMIDRWTACAIRVRC